LFLTLFTAPLAKTSGALAATDPPVYDMRPWLVLRASGSDFAGKPFETDAFIFRGGPTFVMSSRGEEPTAALRAVAQRGAMAGLRRALRDSHIGQQQGNCGQPMPDFIAGFELVWYPTEGPHQIAFGGDLSGCPKELQNALQGICSFLFDTVGPAFPACPLPASAPTWAAEPADP
jgi:hypothetical protein